MVGQARFEPALQPIYSAPRLTTSTIGANRPRLRHSFNSWKVFPPPTITISVLSMAAIGSSTLWIPVTLTAMGAITAATLAV